MKHSRLLVIDCGANTCASKPGQFCIYLRTSNFGTRWMCHLYDQTVEEDQPGGWLQRVKSCKEEFKVISE